MWYWIIIGFIIFFVVLYVLFKLIGWVIDASYHRLHPEKKKLNKRLLKSHLIAKYGKEGKNIYKQMKKKIWENYKIR